MSWFCSFYATLGDTLAAIPQVLVDLDVWGLYADSVPARDVRNLGEGVSTRWKELLAAESEVDKEAGIAQQEGSVPWGSSRYQ